uniref:Uncharacterized protein n=1 Tax=Romanomermis culicivorax TaxID=13658 RepID=A0A915J993_ROMCU
MFPVQDILQYLKKLARLTEYKEGSCRLRSAKIKFPRLFQRAHIADLVPRTLSKALRSAVFGARKSKTVNFPSSDAVEKILGHSGWQDKA